MVGRLEALIGPQAARVWAGTFHHIGNRLLRRSAERLGYGPNFTILDSEDQLDLIRLAMDDAGLVGTGKMAPKPALVPHLISYRLQRAAAPGRVDRRSPSGPRRLDAPARSRLGGVRQAQAGRQLHGLRRPARPVGPADRRVPRPEGRARADVPPHPHRRDAGHQHDPGRARRVDRPRRPGQPDGRRRRRPVDLPVPGGQLRQHPQVPRAQPGRPRLPA